MTTIFFTSDTHFGHANSLKHGRPFSSVEEMDETIIERWNAKVGPKDTVYHLGDVAFRNKTPVDDYLRRLNGIKYLIIGNHDPYTTEMSDQWAGTSMLMHIKLDKQLVVLCHFPLERWDQSHRGSIHLHGHEHGALPGNHQRIDVGADCWNYEPVSLDEIKVRLLMQAPYPGPKFS